MAGRRRGQSRASGCTGWPLRQYPPSTQPANHPKRPRSSSEFLHGKKGYVDPFTRRGVIGTARLPQAQNLAEGQPHGSAVASTNPTLPYRRIRHPSNPLNVAEVRILPQNRSRMAPPSVRLQPPPKIGGNLNSSSASQFAQDGQLHLNASAHMRHQVSPHVLSAATRPLSVNEARQSPAQQTHYAQVRDHRGVLHQLPQNKLEHARTAIPLQHCPFSASHPQFGNDETQLLLSQSWDDHRHLGVLGTDDVDDVNLYYQENSFDAKWGGATPNLRHPLPNQSFANGGRGDDLHGYTRTSIGQSGTGGIARFKKRKSPPPLEDSLGDVNFGLPAAFTLPEAVHDQSWPKENFPEFERTQLHSPGAKKPWESFVRRTNPTPPSPHQREIADVPVEFVTQQWPDSRNQEASVLSCSPGHNVNNEFVGRLRGAAGRESASGNHSRGSGGIARFQQAPRSARGSALSKPPPQSETNRTRSERAGWLAPSHVSRESSQQSNHQPANDIKKQQYSENMPPANRDGDCGCDERENDNDDEVSHAKERHPTLDKPDWLRVFRDDAELDLHGHPVAGASMSPRSAEILRLFSEHSHTSKRGNDSKTAKTGSPKPQKDEFDSLSDSEFIGMTTLWG